MSNQWGRNGGLTGLFDFPGLGAKFEGTCHRWEARLTGATRARRGRGGGRFRTVRFVFGAGNGLAKISMRGDGWPAPDAFKGQTGTVTVTVLTGKTVTYTVLVTEAGTSFEQGKQESPVLLFSYEILGDPTYAGWAGTQPAATDPAKADQQQYEGTNKTLDTKNLLSNCVVVIDFWGTLGDNDAAETSKLTSVIAAALPPMTGQKLRTATFARDALDGGTITLVYGLTDSVDDRQMPGTYLLADPDQVSVQGLHTTVFEAGAAEPVDATVTEAAGDVQITGSRVTFLNDLAKEKVWTLGSQTPRQTVEWGGTFTNADPLHLASEAGVTAIAPTSSPPAVPSAPLTELQHVGRNVRQHTLSKSIFEDRYKVLNTEQEVTFPETRTETDPTSLGGAVYVPVPYDEGGSPVAPTPPTGFKVADSIDRPITPGRRVRIYRLARMDAKDEAEREHKRTVTDPNGLRSETFDAAVFLLTGGAPATPSAPSGQKLRRFQDLELNLEYSVRVWEWGTLDSKDEIELPPAYLVADPSNIDSRGVATKLDASPTVPAGYVSRGTKTSTPVPGHTLYETELGLRSTADDRQMPGTYLVSDPDGVEVDGLHTTVFHAGDPEPSDVTVTEATGDVQITGSKVTFVNNVTKEKVWTLGHQTPRQKIEWGETVTRTDPFGLDSRAAAVQLAPTSSPPAVPSAPLTELQHVARTVRQHTLSKSIFQDDYDVLTSVQRLLYQHARASADPLGMYKSSVPSIVNYAGDERALAESVRDANAADITFDTVDVLRINPTQVLQIITYTGEDKRIHSESSHTSQVSVRGTPTGGYGSTGAQMLIAIDGVSLDAGVHWSGYASFQDQLIWRTTGSFALRRRFLVDVIDTNADSVPDTPDLATVRRIAQVGTVNDAEWLGHPAHSVMYTGASLVYSRKLLTKHLVVVDFLFDKDDRLFFNDGLLFGCRFYVSGLATTNPGLIAANLIWPSAAITWPAATTFTFHV